MMLMVSSFAYGNVSNFLDYSRSGSNYDAAAYGVSVAGGVANMTLEVVVVAAAAAAAAAALNNNSFRSSSSIISIFHALSMHL